MTRTPRVALFTALRWPDGWVRNETRYAASFSGDRTLTAAVKALVAEVALVRRYVADSVNVTVADGTATPSRHEDPGAAVYFTAEAGEIVMACDRWDYAAHNVWAIAQHINALRSIARWGVGSAKQTWGGFTKLPAHTKAATKSDDPSDGECDNAETRARWKLMNVARS